MEINLKTLQALAKHISPKSKIRYYLVGVLLEVTDKGRYYVATDGHKHLFWGCAAPAPEPMAEAA